MVPGIVRLSCITKTCPIFCSFNSLSTTTDWELFCFDGYVDDERYLRTHIDGYLWQIWKVEKKSGEMKVDVLASRDTLFNFKCATADSWHFLIYSPFFKRIVSENRLNSQFDYSVKSKRPEMRYSVFYCSKTIGVFRDTSHWAHSKVNCLLWTPVTCYINARSALRALRCPRSHWRYDAPNYLHVLCNKDCSCKRQSKHAFYTECWMKLRKGAMWFWWYISDFHALRGQ